MNARIELFRECKACKLVKPLDLGTSTSAR
jgi:hypothetical protein